MSGTEKTDSDVDSVISFPCLFPREGAGILTTNAIYLHEKSDLDLLTTENSSIFRLLTKESMLLTSATFLIEKRS